MLWTEDNDTATTTIDVTVCNETLLLSSPPPNRMKPFQYPSFKQKVSFFRKEIFLTLIKLLVFHPPRRMKDECIGAVPEDNWSGRHYTVLKITGFWSHWPTVFESTTSPRIFSKQEFFPGEHLKPSCKDSLVHRMTILQTVEMSWPSPEVKWTLPQVWIECQDWWSHLHTKRVWKGLLPTLLSRESRVGSQDVLKWLAVSRPTWKMKSDRLLITTNMFES